MGVAGMVPRGGSGKRETPTPATNEQNYADTATPASPNGTKPPCPNGSCPEGDGGSCFIAGTPVVTDATRVTEYPLFAMAGLGVTLAAAVATPFVIMSAEEQRRRKEREREVDELLSTVPPDEGPTPFDDDLTNVSTDVAELIAERSYQEGPVVMLALSTVAPPREAKASISIPSTKRPRIVIGVLTAAWLLCAGLFGVQLVMASAKSIIETAAIESLAVGRGLPHVANPTGESDSSLGPIDPPNWRRVDLLAPKTDGTFFDVTLLRPLACLDEQQATVGGTVFFEVPECGISGHAKVLAIGPCPPLVTSSDTVTITGTFRHHSARVLDLYVAGEPAPIGTTANHPFWSEDRQAFVRADSLRPAETLRTLYGPRRVVRWERRSGPGYRSVVLGAE